MFNGNINGLRGCRQESILAMGFGYKAIVREYPLFLAKQRLKGLDTEPSVRVSDRYGNIISGCSTPLGSITAAA